MGIDEATEVPILGQYNASLSNSKADDVRIFGAGSHLGHRDHIVTR